MEVDTQESVKSYNRILHRAKRTRFSVQRSAFGARRSVAQEIREIFTCGDVHGHPLQSDEEREWLRLTY